VADDNAGEDADSSDDAGGVEEAVGSSSDDEDPGVHTVAQGEADILSDDEDD
jgi:hypothetical protein